MANKNGNFGMTAFMKDFPSLTVLEMTGFCTGAFFFFFTFLGVFEYPRQLRHDLHLN